MTSLDKKVEWFKKLKKGPEAALVTSLVEKHKIVISSEEPLIWIGSCLQVGAGEPDLLVVNYRPELSSIPSQVNTKHARLLAYLRSVSNSKPCKIAIKTGLKVENVLQMLEDLIRAHAVIEAGGAYKIAMPWKNILEETVAIEAKISDWKKAVGQASRNRMFVHRSYIALPKCIAMRIKDEPSFESYGLGIIAVEDDGGVTVIRKSPRRVPKNWYYYYYIACMMRIKIPKNHNVESISI